MQQTAGQRTIQKAAWRIMPIVCAGLVLSFMDRVNLSFAALTMNRDLGLSQAAFGFIAGVFFLGYFLFEIPSNLLLERVGARRWLARIMTTWGLVTCLTAFVANATQLSVLRFVLGLAEAGYSPGVLFFLSLWFPDRYRAQMFAYFMIAQPVGAIVGGPVAGALLSLDGFMGFKGWQWMFLLEGLPAILLGSIIYRALQSTPAEAKWLPPVERAWLTDVLTAEKSEVARVGVTSLWVTFRNPRMIMLSLGYGAYASCFWVVVFFLPQIIKATGASSGAVNLLSALPYVGAAIVTFFMGRVADRTDVPERWIFALTVIAAVGLGAMAYFGTSSWSLGGAIVAMAGILGFMPLFWAILPRFLTGSAAAGGFAFVNSLSSLGGFAGPFLFGWVVQRAGGYSGSLWIFAAVALACGVTWLTSARFAAPMPLPPDVSLQPSSTRSG